MTQRPVFKYSGAKRYAHETVTIMQYYEMLDQFASKFLSKW